MAVLKTDADGGEPGGKVLCRGVDFIKACTTPSERADDFVHQDSARETPAHRSEALHNYARRGNLPAAHNLALAPAHRDVVSNNNKLHPVRLVGMEGRVLFFCQTKVENITGVVPNSHTPGVKVGHLKLRIRHLLDDDHGSAGCPSAPCQSERAACSPCVAFDEIDTAPDLCGIRGRKDATTDGGCTTIALIR